MRFLLPCLALALAAPAIDANACKLAPGRERAQAFRDYDAQHEQWLHATGQRLAQLPDNEIAWAGMLFASADDRDATVLPPAPPTTGVGRLLQFMWCDASGRCPDAVAQWMAAEPDNLFVLMLALDPKNAALADEARARLARATRYDDYYLQTQALVDRLAALPDIAAPPAPPGYTLPPCTFVIGTSLAAYVRTAAIFGVGEAEDLDDDALVDAPLKLRIADILLATLRSPYAARGGAQLGVAAATLPLDRERYCREEARADAQQEAVAWLLTEADNERDVQVGHFNQALRTRNALDAVDAIAAQLPPEHRPEPVDAARVAQCVTQSDD